jgi:hypothetical protein
MIESVQEAVHRFCAKARSLYIRDLSIHKFWYLGSRTSSPQTARSDCIGLGTESTSASQRHWPPTWLSCPTVTLAEVLGETGVRETIWQPCVLRSHWRALLWSLKCEGSENDIIIVNTSLPLCLPVLFFHKLIFLLFIYLFILVGWNEGSQRPSAWQNLFFLNKCLYSIVTPNFYCFRPWHKWALYCCLWMDQPYD